MGPLGLTFSGSYQAALESLTKLSAREVMLCTAIFECCATFFDHSKAKLQSFLCNAEAQSTSSL